MKLIRSMPLLTRWELLAYLVEGLVCLGGFAILVIGDNPVPALVLLALGLVMMVAAGHTLWLAKKSSTR